MEKYICSCGKEYIRKDFYEKHIKKCEIFNEKISNLDEIDTNLDEIDTNLDEIDTNLDEIDTNLDENVDFSDKSLYIKTNEIIDLNKAEVLDDIIDLFNKLNGIVPKDKHTKSQIVILYNKFYHKDIICDDCEFDSIFSDLKSIYQSITK